MISYELRRSRRRRTIALSVRERQLVVQAPQWVSRRDIDAFVLEKQRWIQKQLTAAVRQEARQQQRQYCTGDEFWYMGEVYQLQVLPNVAQQDNAVALTETQLQLQVHQPTTEAVKAQIFQWYQEQAQAYMVPKAHELAALIGRTIQRVRFGQYKTQWGSCQRDGRLSFNWQLVQAPITVIDYVIAHEVCHLVHMNHSQRFWQKVASICPDYQAQRQWLRRHGQLLYL